MQKFFYKKEASQEATPILLERRHTRAGVEGSNPDILKNRTSRSNSIGDYLGSSNPKNSVRNDDLTPRKRRLFPLDSSRIITETQLTSSSLYKNQKAQIDSTDEESITGSRSQLVDKSSEDILIYQKVSRTRDVPPALPYCVKANHGQHHGPSHRRRPRSNRCAMVMVVCCICIAIACIFLGLGAIWYMELYVNRPSNQSEPVNLEPELAESGDLTGDYVEYDEDFVNGNRTHIFPGNYFVPEVAFSETSQKDGDKNDADVNHSSKKSSKVSENEEGTLKNMEFSYVNSEFELPKNEVLSNLTSQQVNIDNDTSNVEFFDNNIAKKLDKAQENVVGKDEPPVKTESQKKLRTITDNVQFGNEESAIEDFHNEPLRTQIITKNLSNISEKKSSFTEGFVQYSEPESPITVKDIDSKHSFKNEIADLNENLFVVENKIPIILSTQKLESEAESSLINALIPETKLDIFSTILPELETKPDILSTSTLELETKPERVANVIPELVVTDSLAIEKHEQVLTDSPATEKHGLVLTDDLEHQKNPNEILIDTSELTDSIGENLHTSRNSEAISIAPKNDLEFEQEDNTVDIVNPITESNIPPNLNSTGDEFDENRNSNDNSGKGQRLMFDIKPEHLPEENRSPEFDIKPITSVVKGTRMTPFEFVRRLEMDQRLSELPLQETERKFSLAEALEYLKSMDQNNPALESRQKNAQRKRKNPNKEKEDLNNERMTYLNNLRRKFFDQ